MITLYTLKSEGKYYRWIPRFPGSGALTWCLTDDPKKAKVFRTIGTARGQRTVVVNMCLRNKIPVPEIDLVELATTETIII